MAKRRMAGRIWRWEEFYRATEGDPPCDTLVKALDLFDSEQAARRSCFAGKQVQCFHEGIAGGIALGCPIEFLPSCDPFIHSAFRHHGLLPYPA